MRANCHTMNDMRHTILSFEKIIFKSKQPVKIEKIIPDSCRYDCSYDTDVRRNDVSLICLLNELMASFGKTSECWLMQNEIEEYLTSPDFYRDMIFKNRCPSYDDFSARLKSQLEKEISFLKENLTDARYKSVCRSMGKELPKTMKLFYNLVEKAFGD